MRGRYDCLHGRPAQARRAWSKGLAAAALLHIPYEQGLSHEEIGKMMDCNVGTVRSRLFYARQQLQAYLSDYLK